MKISQMTTDKAADVLVRIVEPASNLVHDANVFKMLEDLANDTDVSPLKFVADNITTITFALLKEHKLDVFEIVAALSDKTADDVSKQKITKTIKDIKESMDGELVDFFGSLK